METKYKLTEANLDIEVDLDFIDNVLQCYGVRTDPQVRDYLLDLAYTFARNKLVEARRFANLNKKSYIDVNDLHISQMEETEELQFKPFLVTQPVDHTISSPEGSANPSTLLLPPWRSCQVGTNAQLKQLVAENKASRPAVSSLPPPKIPRTREPHYFRML